MISSLQQSTDRLDGVRRSALGWLLKFDVLRGVYLDPSRRGLWLFSGSIAVALGFALVAPLWQLLLGPMVFGVVHLFSTIRFVPRAIESSAGAAGDERRGRTIQVVLWCGAYLVLCRWSAMGGVPGAGHSEWEGLALLEGGFVLGLFVLLAVLYRPAGARGLFGGACLMLVAVSFWWAPMASAGAFVLLHHLVAFAYWIAVARDASCRRSARLALGSFLAVNGVLFSGLLDPLLVYFAGGASIGFAAMDPEALGRMILPWSDDPHRWRQATAAFAFGQSLHYFVWLKAIPDECRSRKVPGALRNSLVSLERDFGPRGLRLLLFSLGASGLAWIFVEVPVARAYYFLLAGFHGLVEIAALPLLRRGRGSRGA